ncbi:hypothetical protein FJ366_03675 [Candidatus Dependentiae bacterium]|nr:hypothetical protein [Candidatus Dependentiae bacterium]
MNNVFEFLNSFNDVGTKLLVLFFALKLLIQWWNESGILYFETEKNTALVNENLLKKDISSAQDEIASKKIFYQEKIEQLQTIQEKITEWQKRNLQNHELISSISTEKSKKFSELQQKKVTLIIQNKKNTLQATKILCAAQEKLTLFYTANQSLPLDSIILKITKKVDEI